MLGGQEGRLRGRSVALLVSPSRAVPRYGAFFNGLLADAPREALAHSPIPCFRGLVIRSVKPILALAQVQLDFCSARI